MRPISPRVKNILNTDPFYKKCCITGRRDVTMHHVWIYRMAQIDEAWAIVPLSASIHTSHLPTEIRERCELISLIRATDEELANFPKKDWKQIKKYLLNKWRDTK